MWLWQCKVFDNKQMQKVTAPRQVLWHVVLNVYIYDSRITHSLFPLASINGFTSQHSLSQFIITVTRVSQNMSQDDSCHNFRDDVPDFLLATSTRTGHCAMASLVTTRVSGAASDDSSPGSVKSSATNNQSSARPGRMRINNIVGTALCSDLGCWWPTMTARGRGLVWTMQGSLQSIDPSVTDPGQRGRPGLTLDIIYFALHHWLYSCLRLKYAWNK